MVIFNFMMEEKNTVYAGESIRTTQRTFAFEEHDGAGTSRPIESLISPLAPPFRSQNTNGNDLINMFNQFPDLQQISNSVDRATYAIEYDKVIKKTRRNNNEAAFAEMVDHGNIGGHLAGNNAPNHNDPLASPAFDWGENNASGSKQNNNDVIETFDFFLKSLSSANNFVSMLTREQLSVLRSIRPNLLHEFLQEIAKARSNKKGRRALPNECAFCKNNGENEEYYSQHVLKDWRGRVECPVLRAFTCPQCGATGDWAHTIKYCPENQNGLEGSGSFGSRRRTSPTFMSAVNPPSAPASSPSAATANFSNPSVWGSFGLN